MFRIQFKHLKRSPVKKSGRQTKANRASNARLKKRFTAMGIESCELGYENCTKDNFLSWAHGRKRRHLQGDELDTLVILSCLNCHTRIERMPESAMCAIVESVIAERVSPARARREVKKYEPICILGL